jgi:hypothetical protein
MNGIGNRLDLTVIADAPAKDDPTLGGSKAPMDGERRKQWQNEGDALVSSDRGGSPSSGDNWRQSRILE